jgi:signal peptidase I
VTEVADAPEATEEPQDDAPPPPARARRIKWLLEWVLVLLVAVTLAFVVRTWVVQTYFIPSSSMVPTLQIGDRILVLKAAYRFTSPAIGDVVVFHPPTKEAVDCGGPPVSTLVKRIVATGGDEIRSSGSTIYVNEKPLTESWPHVDPLGAPIKDQVVPAGRYFMLGDNHPESCDSRAWGTVRRSELIGKAVLTFWPLSHVGII